MNILKFLLKCLNANAGLSGKGLKGTGLLVETEAAREHQTNPENPCPFVR
jgi:hypothetical protein